MSVPSFQVLTYEVAARVCTLTLNRPEKRNALSAQLVNELIVGLECAEADPDVRVVVLTGAGGVFCSGGDLSQMSAGSDDESDVPFRGGFVELNLTLERLSKPVIAKVRRYALAGATSLVCGAHFCLAEESAKFGTPEVDRGLFPFMVLATLFRNVGRRAGLELVLTGNTISAQRAASIGLITRAVPADTLDEEVAELAANLARKPPGIIAMGLQAYREQGEQTLAEALPALQSLLVQALGSREAAEGIAAFLQKREPSWR